MKRKFKIGIASAEMVPFAKVGGLADVVGSLSKRLAAMGHDVRPQTTFSPDFGGGQVIAIDPETGVLSGGSDPRKDGCAIGF